MGEVRRYESFPVTMVAASVLVTISIYALGALILGVLGPVVAAAYLLYCAFFELRVMGHSCVNCCYYGKVCALGRGKISAYIFPQGDPEIFARMNITWAMLIPDVLVMLLPLLGGVILLVRSFSWMVALGMVLLTALALGGNAFVRTRIACKYCKQREIGCPAEKFFGGAQTH
jgi:uncharacterized membrane protein YphA (DoxX/SURF4 family)